MIHTSSDTLTKMHFLKFEFLTITCNQTAIRTHETQFKNGTNKYDTIDNINHLFVTSLCIVAGTARASACVWCMNACTRDHCVRQTNSRKRKGLRPFRNRDRAGCSEWQPESLGLRCPSIFSTLSRHSRIR